MSPLSLLFLASQLYICNIFCYFPTVLGYSAVALFFNHFFFFSLFTLAWQISTDTAPSSLIVFDYIQSIDEPIKNVDF